MLGLNPLVANCSKSFSDGFWFVGKVSFPKVGSTVILPSFAMNVLLQQYKADFNHSKQANLISSVLTGCVPRFMVIS